MSLSNRRALRRSDKVHHHDPFHDDDDIKQMHTDSIRYEELTREGAPLEVLCSYDGLEVVL